MTKTAKSWKWLKRVLWSLLGLVVLLFLAISVLVYLVNSESYLEDYLTENLGVEANIGELDVSLLSGTVKISSSTIGPKDDPYIQFEELKGELDYSHLWSSQLTVELLRLTNAKVRYPFEFKLKESESTNEEESSLLFDFIDVAAIDINNLNFEYRDDINLLAEGADIKVRNLPVAESGFLLFGDLERLVKASQTTIEASLTSLKSDKTQLNNLSLSAYVEGQKLIVEDVKSGESSININLLDHSQVNNANSTASTDNKLPVSNTEQPELELPFNDVVIQSIDLGKTDLAIQDKEELSIKAIEAEFSELLLVKDKKALWLDWPSFYQAQDSEFQLRSDIMASSMVDYERLSLEGELKQGVFTLPKFSLEKPVIKISSDSVEAGDEASSSADQSSWYLPFKTARLVNGVITQGKLELAQGDEKHHVSDINLELANLPLVVEHKPIFVLDKLDVGNEQATVTLQSAAYSGAMGTVDKITSQLVLNNSSLNIKNLSLTKPNIQYQLVAIEESGSASAESSVSAESSASPENNESSAALPIAEIVLSQLTVNGAELDLSLDNESYVGKDINVSLKSVPIYQEQQWIVAQPDLWKEQTLAQLEVQSLQLPQGSLTGLLVNSSLENNQLKVTELKLASADLAINVIADGAENTNNSSSSKLPIASVELENIDLNQVGLDYRNDDVGYQLSGGDLTLNYFPLIKEGQFVSDPMPYLEGRTSRISLNAATIQTPEGTVSGLSTQGLFRDKDLMLDYLRTESANIDITLAAHSGEAPEESVQQSETAAEDDPFIFRTVKIGDLKLRDVNAEITQPIDMESGSEGEQTSEQLLVHNLYLGATELILVKNHQTIDQWYGSQLENVFTLIALKVSHIQQNQNDVRDLTVTAVQSNGQIKVQPLRLTYNEAPLSGEWTIDLTQQPYQSRYVSDFNNLLLEKLIEPADEESVAMSGALQGDIDITFSGLDADSILSSLDGSVIVGNQSPVMLKRLNINKVLRSFLDSQSFGLLDIGGFLLAGPLGLLASQGVSLQDTLSQLGADKGDTILSNLHVDMSLAEGVLQTKDVAAATEKYRFAFNGQINLAKQEFNDFRFDLINEKGCSEYGQTLNGSLTSPEIETFTAAFDAVTGSIVGLFKQGVGLITGGACSAVYEGVVPHPKEGAVIIPKERQQTIDPNAPDPNAPEEEANGTEGADNNEGSN